MRHERTVHERVAGPHVLVRVRRGGSPRRARRVRVLRRSTSRCRPSVEPTRSACPASYRRCGSCPTISAMTAGLRGRRASNSSVTRGRPPVMSCVLDSSRGVLASSVPAETFSPSRTCDVGPFRNEVRLEDVAAVVLDENLRVQVALVLDDREAFDAAGRVALPADRLAFLDVLAADLPGLFRDDRDMACGSQRHSGVAAWTSCPSATSISAPFGTLYRSATGPALPRRMVISPVRVRAMSCPALFVTTVIRSRATTPPFFALNSLSAAAEPVAAPPMWNVRIVSCVPGSPIDWAAMMPTARPSSTSGPGRQVHAVAQPADARAAPRRSAGCGR